MRRSVVKTVAHSRRGAGRASRIAPFALDCPSNNFEAELAGHKNGKGVGGYDPEILWVASMTAAMSSKLRSMWPAAMMSVISPEFFG